MPQHEATLPISCVEGWSANAHWKGVRVRDVLAATGARSGSSVLIGSIQKGGLYRKSTLTAGQAGDIDALFALEVNGEALDIEHGYPLRLIAPNRPGVLQTKWLNEVEVR
jgi:DMSO/TMAO reductase YedYZ molybdopterin-dependent catalytic subunit